MASFLKKQLKNLDVDEFLGGKSKSKKKGHHQSYPDSYNMAYQQPPPGYGHPQPQPYYGHPQQQAMPQPYPQQAYGHPSPQPPPHQSQFYGNYGQYYNNVYKVNACEAYQFKQIDDLQLVFTQEMNKNPENVARGALQSEDLMNVLNNTPSIRNFYRISWSREMCSIMIAMLDRSQDGFMQWNEFMELQQCLVAWHKCFRQHDFDNSGFIDSTELIRVIRQLFGFQIQPPTLETILKRYSRVVPPNSRCIIAFDDFVTLSVRLRAYTDAFRKRDKIEHHGQETGACTLGYEDYLRCVLCL